MILIESIIGNANDAEWQARLEGASADTLMLDQWEAQKNRFRKTTEGGTELAISLERSVHLRDGDILVWNPETRSVIIADIHLKEVMVVELGEMLTQSPEIIVRTCVELGHAIGNQHWPAVVNGTKLYVPLTVDKKVMGSVMRTHAFQGITYDFVPGSEIIPYLAPHEARRLFGGAEGPVHTHTNQITGEHAHPHDRAKTYDHEH